MGKSCIFRNETDFSEITKIDQFMKEFCDKGRPSLSLKNFSDILSNLLTNSEGKSYDVPESLLNKLFSTFDRNEDDFIDIAEFGYICNNFIKPLIHPVNALLIIDVQNDFIDGSLAMKNCPAKQDGYDVVPIINNLLENHKFDVIIYTYDYHPKSHISFFENVHLYKLSEKSKPAKDIKLFDTVMFEGPPEMKQIMWPTHCVQNSWGSELHKDLKLAKDSLSIFKGTSSTVDSYSAFFDNMKISKTNLDDELKKRNVSHVFICGLAFDYCVSYTAQDAVELGYATTVLQDATRGTDDILIKSTVDNLKSLNCVISQSSDVENLLNGNDIKVEYACALQNILRY